MPLSDADLALLRNSPGTPLVGGWPAGDPRGLVPAAAAPQAAPPPPVVPAPAAQAGGDDPAPHLDAISGALEDFKAAGSPADLAPHVKQFVRGHYQSLTASGYFDSPDGQPVAKALKAQGFAPPGQDAAPSNIAPSNIAPGPAPDPPPAGAPLVPTAPAPDPAAPSLPVVQSIHDAIARYGQKVQDGTWAPGDVDDLKGLIAGQMHNLQKTGYFDGNPAGTAWAKQLAASDWGAPPSAAPVTINTPGAVALSHTSGAGLRPTIEGAGGLRASLDNTFGTGNHASDTALLLRGLLPAAGAALKSEALGAGNMVAKYGDGIMEGASTLLGNSAAAAGYDRAAGRANAREVTAGQPLMNILSAAVPGTLKDLTTAAAQSAGGQPSAARGTLSGVPRGYLNEVTQHPTNALLNVLSVVGGGELGLAKGAEGAAAAAGSLSKAAAAAEAAGDFSRASSLRGAAQTAGNLGQDLKVAGVRYNRAVTGGKAGDAVSDIAGLLARKYAPGSKLAQAATDGAVGRSLGKAVSDAYPGYKILRAQSQGRIAPQPGDVNIGGAGVAPPPTLPLTRAGGPPPASPLLAALTGGNRPALTAPPAASSPAPSTLLDLGLRPPPAAAAPPMAPPAPGVRARPVETAPAPNVRALLPAPPTSPAGKSLHPTADGENGAARHADGTFAPVPASPAPLPAQDARLVPGFPVSQLHLDPDRFQYKIGTGQGGNSGSLTDVKAFNPDFAGVVHAWRDPADGQAYVVNGHNRVGLARRTGTPGIDVRFLDAQTAGEARTKGALINIAEGQGTALDAAKLFRETGYTQEDISRLGVNLTGQKASQGLALASLNPGLFSSAMKGEMPVERAALIGGRLPGHGDQATLLKQMGDRSLTNGQVGEMADAIAQGPRHTSQTSSLFGTDEVSTSLAPERAEAADYINSQLAKEGGAFGNASRNADRLARGNNRIDAAESARLATLSAQGREIFGQVKNAPGEVSDLLGGAAKRLARAKETGETRDAIKRDALSQFQTYVERTVAPTHPGAGAGVSARAGGGADGGQQGSGLLGGRPGGGGTDPAPSVGRQSQSAGSNGQGSRPSVAPSSVLTPGGRQIALRGASGTVYVNQAAYTDIMGRMGASGATQGVTLRPPHVQEVQAALHAAVRAAGPGNAAYAAELRTVADHLTRAGRGKSGSPKSGVPVVKVEPGQTLSETKAVARHERTHAASYDYPLSDASRGALDRALSQPSHPLHSAYAGAKAALTARGYAPGKTWDEIPAVLAAGPSQFSKMGLSDREARDLATEYASHLIAEHGPEAVRAVFAHGASAARQVARQTPSAAPVGASHPSASPVPAGTSPDASNFLSPVTHFIGRPRLLTLDEIADVRKAGLLSSPKQIVKAVAGHVAAMGTDELARLPASAIDLLTSAATGRDRTVSGVRLQDLAVAARKGATEGIKLGWTVMRHGSHGLAAQGMSHPMLPANHPEFKTGMGLLDTYVSGVFRAHESAYAALRVFALHRSLLELAHLGALNSVRRGLIPKAQQEAMRQHLYSQPSQAMMAAAISAAEEATLTNANAFSKMYQGAYDKAPPVGRLVMSQLAPFPKLESNFAGRSLEMAGGAAYAPLRFAMTVMKKNGYTADDQRRFSMTFGRGLVGVGLIALGAMLYAKGRGQASDEKHHQPGTVEAKGRLLPTNTLGSASNLVQLGIDVASGKHRAEQEGQPAYQQPYAHAGDALANLLMEQPWLKANPGDLTQMLESGADGKRQIGQQAGSFVPAVLADLAAQRDPYKRSQKEPLDFVRARIPGQRETLPVQKDLLGNPRPEAPDRLFNPFGGTPVGPADTPGMRALRQALDARRAQAAGTGDPSAAQQARQDVSRGILDRAAQGQDIKPLIQAGLLNHTLTLPGARRLIAESRMTPVQQKVDLLPLDMALDVYAQASLSERAALRPVMLRKLAGAARARSLTPATVSRAQALGIGPGAP